MKLQSQGGFLIAKIHQLSGRIFTKLLKKHQIEINPAQGRIMFVLWRDDNIPIQELAKKTSLSKTTLTSMLDRLEIMGYIARVPSNEDRRKICIKLTEKDKSLHEKYRQVSLEMTELFYQGLSNDDIALFEKQLEITYKNLIVAEKNLK
ncbi:MAG: MarR family transcriptional regulator [Candidatus Heimdallarchaeota archaeon]|nr:MarR family transcriptional regulator [Candidatus Heimdallarchaeota archaeon]MCG3253759.1 MarR family transcriptional regulator [Candidatus Heimdallarchaeota archaeon]MCK4290894.1 MarR family transcriptional regulator [Candidatus Heimdallarchaeota archaeon]